MAAEPPGSGAGHVEPAVAELELTARVQPSAGHARAQALLADPAVRTDPVLTHRLTLVLAECAAAMSNDEAAVDAIHAELDWATAHRQPHLEGRAHRHLAVVYRRAGATDEAVQHALAAVSLLPDDAPDRLRADHLQILADALGTQGVIDEAMLRYQQAARLARRAQDWWQLAIILNNEAYTWLDERETEKALVVAHQLEELHATLPGPPIWAVLDTVATAYLQGGRLDEAERTLVPMDRFIGGGGTFDDTSDLVGLVTLASVRRRKGDLAGADRTLAAVHALGYATDISDVAVVLLEEQAELLAAQGDLAAALDTYREFHRRSLALRSEEQAARTRAFNAAFNGQEARRERETLRRLALRDPLTGLANRRMLADHLATLLQPGTGQTTLAIIDLDHFKTVNDRFSHQVGDWVLVRVAALLDRLASTLPGGLAVRLGGEEMVVVARLGGAPGCAEPAELGERLRRGVAELDWSALELPDLQVTASVGVACSPADGATQDELLAAADRRLYAAKAAGRDVVVVDDGAVPGG